jgi:hypothetical protein
MTTGLDLKEFGEIIARTATRSIRNGEHRPRIGQRVEQSLIAAASSSPARACPGCTTPIVGG